QALLLMRHHSRYHPHIPIRRSSDLSRNPPPMLPGAGLDCPPPMLWRAGEPRPWLVRVVNHGADSIEVFLECCLEVRRVGDVGPGKTRLFPLPQGLIVYEDGLRMHVV